MPQKTFGAKALNDAVNTVSDALENPSVTPMESTASPQEEEVSLSTKEENTPKQAIETSSSDSLQESDEENKQEKTPQPSVQTKVTNRRIRNKKTKAKEEEVDFSGERTKIINIVVPLSIYKRLFELKADVEGETLKSLSLKAIIRYLQDEGY